MHRSQGAGMASFSTAASHAAHAISAAFVAVLHENLPPPHDSLRRVLQLAHDEHLALPPDHAQAETLQVSREIIQSMLRKLDAMAAVPEGAGG